MRTTFVSLTVFLFGCVTAGSSSAESLRETFRRVSPSVVVVRTKQRQLAALTSAVAKTRYVDVMGLGSGVLVKGEKTGLVFPAAHVVQAADEGTSLEESVLEESAPQESAQEIHRRGQTPAPSRTPGRETEPS